MNFLSYSVNCSQTSLHYTLNRWAGQMVGLRISISWTETFSSTMSLILQVLKQTWQFWKKKSTSNR